MTLSKLLTPAGIGLALVLSSLASGAQNRTGDGSKAVPLAHKTTATPASGTEPTGNAGASAGSSAAGPASHKPPLPASGTWTWTSYSPSMQPEENTITLSTDKAGKVTATLTDWLGRHDISNVTAGNGTISFDVLYHYHGIGDRAHTFTVSLDPDAPSVSVQKPDFSPLGKAHGGRRTIAHPAKHQPAG